MAETFRHLPVSVLQTKQISSGTEIGTLELTLESSTRSHFCFKVKTSVPDPKLFISDPDPHIEKSGVSSPDPSVK